MSAAELVDAVARLLDEQEGPGGAYRWNDDPPDGWASQEAFRDAYRLRAAELLDLVVPQVLDILGDRVLPSFAQLVSEGQARRWAEDTCHQQGVPLKVTDPDVVAHVARLLT